ncbi:MAG: response regulator transcription factor [Bryobacteraceae bacterium]
MTNGTLGTIGFPTSPLDRPGQIQTELPADLTQLTRDSYEERDSIHADAPVWREQQRKSVMICDTQPVTAEGLRTLLRTSSDMELLQSIDSLSHAREFVQQERPSVLVIDKAFGIQAILDWLQDSRIRDAGTYSQGNLRNETAREPQIGVVIWGTSITEAEALRFLQAGAKGILRKTAGVPMILSCLRTVSEGRSWMEDCVFRDSGRSDRYPRSELTHREQQVLVLVEQGFKNKEIANELGIRPGTVKIHLKHIFEKTGVRGRYGLAINGLRDRTLATAPA